ncbi:hypothetical protein F4782DRAFT_479603 [Xylaria castorea]|nr:hypothetical protein F4782DRAFT_479603 [Xylaria castorea]
MADWALSVTWRRGYQRDMMRTVMSDAGLAGPLPELLFPHVVLATALIPLFNAVVYFCVLLSLCCFLVLFSIAFVGGLSYTLFYVVVTALFVSSPISVSLHAYLVGFSRPSPTSLA